MMMMMTTSSTASAVGNNSIAFNNKTRKSIVSSRSSIKQQQHQQRKAISMSRNTKTTLTRRSQTRRGASVVVYASQDDGFKVAVLGAAGGIGQSLSLLLKMNPMISDLALYDVGQIVKGVAVDLSHCNTASTVNGFCGNEELGEALKECDLVIIPAGVPRKPGMTRDDLFSINAGIVRDLTQGVADHCPNAVVAIISNPVNSTVPIACEVMKQNGKFDKRKILGVTTLDIVRSDEFVSTLKGLDVNDVDVPVIGGHAGITILPLLSQTFPQTSFSERETEDLTIRIQNAGTEVVEAKAGGGSATLSMAYAAARMGEAILRGLSGESDVYECSYVSSDIVPDMPFFATKCKLGKEGVEEVSPIGDITAYEQGWLDKLKPELKAQIDKGISFIVDAPQKI